MITEGMYLRLAGALLYLRISIVLRLPVNKGMPQNIQWNKDKLRHIQKILCLKQIRP